MRQVGVRPKKVENHLATMLCMTIVAGLSSNNRTMKYR